MKKFIPALQFLFLFTIICGCRKIIGYGPSFVSGTVREEHTGIPLPGIDVYVYSRSGFGAQNQNGEAKGVTDKDGKYSIDFNYSKGGKYRVMAFPTKISRHATEGGEQGIDAGSNRNHDFTMVYISSIEVHFVPLSTSSELYSASLSGSEFNVPRFTRDTFIYYPTLSYRKSNDLIRVKSRDTTYFFNQEIYVEKGDTFKLRPLLF